MDCSECSRLLTERARLARVYTIAFDAANRASLKPTAEFLKLITAADEAKLESKVASMELHQHRRAHGQAT